MNGLGLNLSDYSSGKMDNQFLFGSDQSQEQLENLHKALEAREITGRDTANSTTASGAPLKVESLDKTLKLLTFKESDITFWKSIPKKQAYNTVEEFNQLKDYGKISGGFYSEGELPLESDSVYVRRAEKVKFMGVVKAVTHPMTLVRTMIGDVIQREIKNGTMEILRTANRYLYYGDESIVPDQFNGILSQQKNSDVFSSLDDYYNSEVVIDLRGRSLREEDLENGMNSTVENFGLADTFYAPPKVHSLFVQTFYGNKFIQPNTNQISDGRMGQRVRTFESQFGDVALKSDIFFNKLPSKKSTSGADNGFCPAAPTVGGAPIAAVSVDASSKWFSGDQGDYFYMVTGINKYGESAPLVLDNSATTIVAGGSVDLQFSATAGPNPTTGFRVYRSNKNAASVAAATFYPVFEISTSQLTAGYDGAAATKVRDRNRIMPDTDQAMLVQNDNEVIEYAQLAPLMKLDLAIVSPAYRFVVLKYGTPFLYAPKKMVRYINIGKN